jgi:hypothetical protein
MEAQVRGIAGRVPGIFGWDMCFVRENGIQFLRGPSLVVKGEMNRSVRLYSIRP